MNEFDVKAFDWDKNQHFKDRPETIAKAIIQKIP